MWLETDYIWKLKIEDWRKRKGIKEWPHPDLERYARIKRLREANYNPTKR